MKKALYSIMVCILLSCSQEEEKETSSQEKEYDDTASVVMVDSLRFERFLQVVYSRGVPYYDKKLSCYYRKFDFFDSERGKHSITLAEQVLTNSIEEIEVHDYTKSATDYFTVWRIIKTKNPQTTTNASESKIAICTLLDSLPVKTQKPLPK